MQSGTEECSSANSATLPTKRIGKTHLLKSKQFSLLEKMTDLDGDGNEDDDP